MKTFCSALTLALSTTLAAASPGSVLEDRALTCTPACPSNAVCIAGTTPRCVVPAGSCGGFAGLKCANVNDKCVDDPRDDCDPANGGADCIGICIPKGVTRYK